MTTSREAIAECVFSSARSVAFSEVDADFALQLPALLRRCQDAAARHSERVGLGIRRLREQGRCWLLNRLAIERVGDVGYEDDLAVHTWSRGRVGLRMQRDFTCTVGGREVARGASLWFLLDVASGRPVTVPDAMQAAYGERATAAMAEPLAAWHPATVPPGSATQTCVPRAGDFDPGRHVNNCVYADWLLDALARQGHAPQHVRALRLAFERALGAAAGAATVAVHADDGHAIGQILVGGQSHVRADLRYCP